MLLRFTKPITRLSWPVMLIVMLCVQGVIVRFRPGHWLLPFTIVDWMLMQGLPRAGVSFGPSQPTTLLLMVLRLPLVLLPNPWWWILQGVGTLLVVYGFWIEPQRIRVTTQKLAYAGWRQGIVLRLVHFGDLHMERWTSRETHLLQTIQALQPEMILFSGDFLSFSDEYDDQVQGEVRRLFSQLSAPLGVVVVSGSPPVDPPTVLEEMLAGLPIRWLRDEMQQFEHNGAKFEIVGLNCSHQPTRDGAVLAKFQNYEEGSFRLLLYHSPDLAPVAARMGIDLQLSGHTHGGQVRLPILGAIYTSSLYGKRFEMGRYQIEKLTLYVTRGIGMEGKTAPRVRFLCPPEVTLWEIEGTQ